MTLLAVNDTPLSRRLAQEGRLAVDRFETSGPLTEGAVEGLATTRTPMLLHNGVWNWPLGDPDALSEPDVLHQTRTRLALTDAPWLSVHLGFSAAHVTFAEGMQPASAPLTRVALLATMAQNLRAVRAAARSLSGHATLTAGIRTLNKSFLD